MDGYGLLLLIPVMMVLAALPSTSVALVVVRSARLGVAHGLWVAAGIVMADLLFAALALWGMAELAQQLGSLFALVRIAAGLWLVWFGITLIRNRDTALKTGAISGSSKTVSFLAGLAVTLGDIKAIVFYASLFPLFVNMHAPDVAHLVAVLLITVFSVGCVKAVYACLAQRISRRSNPRLRQPLSIAAGGAMIGAGTWLVTRP
ncbi:MAG: LysE family translocator [Alcanivorax sp.]|uniref:LysE family translocator n=1 Tax=Alcanivorax sp. TaxID=1872427 RepID=UPI00260BF235|nr:LysE family translocator [Alcanivorax sp.]MDF1724441.1 LysE family translocator [Alcanivorax sp.]